MESMELSCNISLPVEPTAICRQAWGNTQTPALAIAVAVHARITAISGTINSRLRDEDSHVIVYNVK